MGMAEELDSLEYTPTWIVALVCSIIVIISLVAERLLHRLGKVSKLYFVSIKDLFVCIRMLHGN